MVGQARQVCVVATSHSLADLRVAEGSSPIGTLEALCDSQVSAQREACNWHSRDHPTTGKAATLFPACSPLSPFSMPVFLQAQRFKVLAVGGGILRGN